MDSRVIGIVLASVSLAVLLAVIAVLLIAFWPESRAERVRRELRQAHSAVDAIFAEARSAMEQVTGQRFNNWRDWS